MNKSEQWLSYGECDMCRRKEYFGLVMEDETDLLLKIERNV